jgi:hypothetical protein
MALASSALFEVNAVMSARHTELQFPAVLLRTGNESVLASVLSGWLGNNQGSGPPRTQIESGEQTLCTIMYIPPGDIPAIDRHKAPRGRCDTSGEVTQISNY